MLYLLWTLLFFLLIFLVFFIGWHFYINVLQPGAIYYPSKDTVVDQMLKLAKVNPKDTLIDIGSGDGRILIAAAKMGTKAIGYEINPLLVSKSRRLVKKAGLENLVTVYNKSFWKADLNEATIITVYLFPEFMNRLQKLIEKKVNHPIRVVANDYPFNKKQPDKIFEKIYLYYFNKV
jgi:protein-L-isoaspartate O-methyltransferase